jgi:hypothetical protein
VYTSHVVAVSTRFVFIVVSALEYVVVGLFI